MNVAAFALRLYRKGFKGDDFVAIADGLLIVEPIRPPAVVSGLHVAEKAREIPGQLCLAHRVVARGFLDDTVPWVEIGDVVLCRLSHLDPIQPDTNLLAIEAKHVLAIIGDADAANEEVADSEVIDST